MIDTLIVMALYVIALGVVLSGIASSSGFVIAVGFILYLVAGLVFPIYNYVIRVGRDGATIGKSMIGLSVVDVDTGGTIGAGRAFIRGLLTFLAFTALFMDRQRGIHDQAARSVVVTGNPTEVPGVGPGAGRAESSMTVMSVAGSALIVVSVVCAFVIGLFDNSAARGAIFGVTIVTIFASSFMVELEKRPTKSAAPAIKPDSVVSGAGATA